MKRRIVVGMSGASGSIYGLRLLEKLRQHENVETHLILTRSAERTMYLETKKLAAEAKELADFHYPVEDIGCRLASGSFPVEAMVVAPCSMPWVLPLQSIIAVVNTFAFRPRCCRKTTPAWASKTV